MSFLVKFAFIANVIGVVHEIVTASIESREVNYLFCCFSVLLLLLLQKSQDGNSASNCTVGTING